MVDSIALGLKESRQRAGLSVQQVANLIQETGLRISPKTIYGWEAGRSYPDVAMFLLLCMYYQVEDILGTFGFANNASPRNNDALNQHEKDHIKNYRALDERGRAAIDSAMERELEFIRQFKGKPAPTPEEIDDLITRLEKNQVMYGGAAAFGGKTASAQITEEQLDALEEFIRKNRVN